ncbi:MAG: hypothetical protein DME46_03445 [Verrucomicrobia bacterium]|nr:MAG: hypothetical protein DME46_03445 [Verrucomicrobiota bacterium]
MDFALVLKDEVSSRVEELLIISALETIAVGAHDGIWFCQHEAYASVRATAGKPSYVEEPDAPGTRRYESPQTLARCEIGTFPFQTIAVPLLVTLRPRSGEVTGIIDMP